MAIMGPMARILVREAAATTASKQELYRLLASHLNTPEERQRFLLSGGPIAAGGPGGPAPSVANSQASIVRRPLTPEAAQRAGQLLARYLGPIAIVVTRRAAQTATDEAELYSMLAERVTDSAERERFIIEAARQR
jgi:serine/threonine-protein kinase